MIKLGKIEEIKDLRTVWPHEALDFTPWLAEEENLNLMGDALNLDLVLEETESSVGSFNADIVATESNTDRRVIIENQLEATNHDHLGKLITYASGKSANIIIWIVKYARDEHKAAIEWLNQHTEEDINFFLVEIKLYKIGKSEPAVKFEIIEQPNNWSKEIKKSSNQNSTLSLLYDYWTAFTERADQNQEFQINFNRRNPRATRWLSYSLGSSKYRIDVCMWTQKEKSQVDFFIKDDKAIYHNLHQNKEKIEEETGVSYEWFELPENKASRISISRHSVLQDIDDWNNQFDWTLENMVKMKKIFLKYV